MKLGVKGTRKEQAMLTSHFGDGCWHWGLVGFIVMSRPGVFLKVKKFDNLLTVLLRYSCRFLSSLLSSSLNFDEYLSLFLSLWIRFVAVFDMKHDFFVSSL